LILQLFSSPTSLGSSASGNMCLRMRTFETGLRQIQMMTTAAWTRYETQAFLRSRCVFRQGWTLIELLALVFIIAVTSVIGKSVASQYGIWAGIGAGAVVAFGCAHIVALFYRWAWRRDARRLQELREKYRVIYRVTAPPTDRSGVVMPKGAEIRVGDYGWEAGPIRKDGLIYLQGLTPDWRLVWHAGFRADQIERIATKPSSQYDYWAPYWAKPKPRPPCPFPVLDRDTPTMGLPHHSHRQFLDTTPYSANRPNQSETAR
jgi:hypothetical protein